MSDVNRWLCVPTEPDACWIPLGMDESNLLLLEQSLKLWRGRILNTESGQGSADGAPKAPTLSQQPLGKSPPISTPTTDVDERQERTDHDS